MTSAPNARNVLTEPIGPRARRRLAALAALTAAGVLILLACVDPAHAGAAANGCLAAPRWNGTGYIPQANADSLPSDVPRPGPDILYRPLVGAPQLQNTGPWRAAPLMISGATAYRKGEFLYQDWLFDDQELTYPSDPKYGGNAADIVEVRLKPLRSATAIRITYNTMIDPSMVAATISLGTSRKPYPMPYNAGASSTAQVFITAHECAGDATRAATGKHLGSVSVWTDLERRQVEIRVPYRIFDPRGRTVRVGAAAGLWDPKAGAYLRPDATKPAFFNIAFRHYGRWVQNTWMDTSQMSALAAKNLSPLYALVDFRKLARKVTDDSGVPKSGAMDRIMVSHFNLGNGIGNDDAGQDHGLSPGTHWGGECSATNCVTPCTLPKCTPYFAGNLQPYSVYIPQLPRPHAGYGLVVSLHGAGSNYNHFENLGPTPPKMWQTLAEAGYPSIQVQPEARGPNYVYKGVAEADVFEAMADIASHYQLDPRHYVLTGTSMGGYGTYKLGVVFPDLWSMIVPNIPAIGVEGSKNVAFLPEIGGPIDPNVLTMLSSLRNVPVLGTEGIEDPLASIHNTAAIAAQLDQLGYRHDTWWFHGEHQEYRYLVKDEYAQMSKGVGQNDRNPNHVTYVDDTGYDEVSQLGLNFNHAYWLSGLTVRDPATSAIGKIDVVSHGFGVGDPTPGLPKQTSGSSYNGSGPWIRDTLTWGPAPSAPKQNALTITAANISTVTVDVDRARVGCDAQLTVSTDGPLTVTLVGSGCHSVQQFTGTPGPATTGLVP